MTENKLLNELKNLIEVNLDPSMFPYQKGNSIRIGKMVIRDSKKGFLIYDCQENKQVAITFCKTAAVALAKSLAKGNNLTSKVIELDNTIQKNYNDAMFFSHSLRVSKDEIRKEVIQTRLEIARTRTEQARSALDYIIFS